MKRTENILWSVLFVGLLFKILHFPGYSLFIVVPLVLLNIFYFFFSLFIFNNVPFNAIFKAESYKFSISNYVLSIFSGVSLSTLCIGILYSIMHYNDDILFLTTGLILSLISFLFILISKKKLNYQDFRRTLIRFIVSISLGTVLMILNNSSGI